MIEPIELNQSIISLLQRDVYLLRDEFSDLLLEHGALLLIGRVGEGAGEDTLHVEGQLVRVPRSSQVPTEGRGR